MFKNYLKVAWRNMIKHKFHSMLNVAGLSIGLAFTFLIAGYVWSELKVNSELKNLHNQYIIQNDWKNPDMGMNIVTLGPLAKALKQEYPNLVANYYRWDGVTSNVSKADKVFREGLQIGDSSLLTMYGFKLLYGDAKHALDEPFTAVITTNRAMKYFGKIDVLGETLTIESFSGSKHDFKITGVMEMPAENSVTHFTFDNDNQVYIPTSSAAYFSRSVDAWDNPYLATYVELHEGIKPANLRAPMEHLLRKYSTPQIADNMRPYLAPLQDYYLKQNQGLVKKMLYTVSFIALFILLMAIVNFINISIGKSSTRIKEIGVRKVMGGLKQQLIYQFLIESILIVFFSMLLALLLYSLANPFLSAALGKDIPPLSDFPVYYFLAPLALVFFVGIIAGIYPAFILSALRTVDSVKGKLQSVNGNIFLRKTLVGFQFFTASLVLISAIILSKQIALFFSKDLGYNKEYVVSVQLPRDWTDAGVKRMLTARDEFARLPDVAAASISWSVPDGRGSGTMMFYPNGQESSQALPYESLIADEKYLSAFNIPLIAGRNFQSAADSLNMVINESAVKAMGLSNVADAIGRQLNISPTLSLNVIGVIKDFHFGTMKNKILPMVLTHVNFNKVYRLMCFKFKPGNMAASLEQVQKKWAGFFPGASFDYKFMDDSLKQLYRSEIQLKQASRIATTLALVMALLGMIGLLSLSIQKRTKEIGIRKILGASLPDIASLFIKDFLPVILTAGIISIPVAWYIMQKWLNDYSYRVTINAAPFVIAITTLAVFAIILIIIQLAKTALQNPVKNLRTE